MYSSNRFLIFLLLALSASHGVQSQTLNFPENYFTSPVPFRIYLAANFGEIRPDHFHSGIDIKTNSRSGEELLAAAEGFISRITVLPGGFGKAVYIQHPDGHTSVYGHLSRFTPKVEAYIRQKQYETESFSQNLFPQASRFIIKQGDLIGYSGNSGSSNGPHLHFEIRETHNQHPTNPLLYGLPIEDNISPIIRNIMIYPLPVANNKQGISEKTEYAVRGGYGNYTLRENQTIMVPPRFGIGIETYDLLNGYPNKCGVYSIELKIDSTRHSLILFNEFAFNETRYVNSHIDYQERTENRRNIQKTFSEPNNRSRIYETLINRGFIQPDDLDEHRVEFIIRDASQNTSSLRFNFQAVPAGNEGAPDEHKKDYLMTLPYDQKSSYKTTGFEMAIPPDAFYNSVNFKLAITPSVSSALSRTYHVHDQIVPIHKYISIRIKPDSIPAGAEGKLLLGGLDDQGKIFARGGEWKEGMVEFLTRDFGKYLVVIDTVPPTIHPVNFRANQDLSRLTSMRFTIKDDFSGVSGYQGYIDGKWALFEYDPKNDRLEYIFDGKRLEKNKLHELRIVVTDNKENMVEYKTKFKW